ncbi:MAG: hypothetical protein M3020_05325 [Myxococcota bacterium]|jgi:hypothetical protein|nr:hypothetical protein [Myxococcota bacterium]
MEAARETEPIFFAVGKLKLAVLSLCTLGFYQFYWFYRNWQLVCSRSGFAGWWNPLFRSVLAPFFCYSLFKRIDRQARVAHTRRVHPGWTAIAWIAFNLSSRLSEWTWLVSLLNVLPLLHVQASVDELNAELAPQSAPNRRFSPANWALCVLGGLLLGSALADIIAPPAKEALAEDEAAAPGESHFAE